MSLSVVRHFTMLTTKTVRTAVTLLKHRLLHVEPMSSSVNRDTISALSSTVRVDPKPKDLSWLQDEEGEETFGIVDLGIILNAVNELNPGMGELQASNILQRAKLWSDLNFGGPFQIQKRGFRPYSDKHSPDFCALVDDLDEGYLFLRAIKKGAPLSGTESKTEIKEIMENDVWTVNPLWRDWEPPSDNDNVLQSEACQRGSKLIKAATRSLHYERGDGLQRICVEKEPRTTIMNDVILDLKLNREHRHWCRHFVYHFRNALKRSWDNKVGRNALEKMFFLASLSCQLHSEDLKEAGKLPKHHFIESFATNCGEGAKRPTNTHFSVNEIRPKDVINRSDTDKIHTAKERRIRNSRWWSRPYMTIQTKRFVPDCELEIIRSSIEDHDESEEIDGIISAVVKSSMETPSKFGAFEVETRNLALKGLLYNDVSCALVMEVHRATLMQISLVNKEVITSVKTYKLIKDESVNSTAFQELFTDLVLFMWDVHYKTQY